MRAYELPGELETTLSRTSMLTTWIIEVDGEVSCADRTMVASESSYHKELEAISKAFVCRNNSALSSA